MYKQLLEIDRIPLPYEHYTAKALWDDDHRSSKMLEWHLDPESEPASRNYAFIRKSVNWISGSLNIGPGSKIADFGCGPGLYTEPFAETGARVTGIDFSRKSIAYAKKNAVKKQLDIDYIHGDYLQFHADEKFDLITMIYCDLCALSDDQRNRLLRIFNRHLKTCGVLLLDVFCLEAFRKREEALAFGPRLMDGFWSKNDYFGFLKTIKYEDQKIILDKYTIIEQKKQFEIYNWLKYYSRTSLEQEFSRNGLEIMAYYSDVSGQKFSESSHTYAVLARKTCDAPLKIGSSRVKGDY